MSIAPYLASPMPVVRRMLMLAGVKPGEIVYDLGCGDGRIVITAAKEFGAYAVGIEIRKDLALKAMKAVEEAGLTDRVKIINANLFDVDISDADVVTLYLTTSANLKVKPKLERELKPGARVVSHEYEIPGWTPVLIDEFTEDSRYRFLTHRIWLYRR
ncbi:hypothetical protein B6U66_02725 [Candidatus Bathyarchaeota archaeon ex4484_135]|nr:MAG: hypothetical protein B6U66_02725 [Candidatus Bathyarchaeota archaeon ex4484_135]